jgi:hypothetical protein
MSGSAGGNRVRRENIEETVNKYRDEVLSKCDVYKSHVITGSYNATDKDEFGDIDLVVHFNSDSKPNAKAAFIGTILNLPDTIIVPFKSVKYNGRKYLNTGEIITILYPISGTDEYVQIDNIVSLTERELTFKHTFLCFPAPVQGLMLGLVKAACVEHLPILALSSLGIPYNILDENDEYEFNLSSTALTLRKVTYGENYKMLKRVDVWVSRKWNDVETLLGDYNVDTTFDDLFDQVNANVKTARGRNRVAGTFSAMVSVKSGEVGTPKGDEKTRTLEKVNTL